MVDPAIEHVIHGIHASGRHLVLEFAGAGSLGLAWLHSVAGSSRTILEATDRYSSKSLGELLGRSVDKFVTPEIAAAMAQRAYLRAARLSDDLSAFLGVACTATIATDRTKRGGHRVCIAVQDQQSLTTYDLAITKGQRDRHGEESLVALLLINAIAAGAGGADKLALPLRDGEQVIHQSAPAPDPVVALWAQQARCVIVHPDGTRARDEEVRGIIYSGSFNPLHFGHEALAAAASRMTGLPVTFELPAVNADKAPIGRAELERRLAQFHRHRVAITRAPLFRDKAAIFPGCTFVVGYDTAQRLVDNRFYGSTAARDEALRAMREAVCHVLVAGRAEGAKFRTLADLPIPAAAGDLFIELPRSEFRADISATEIRGAEGFGV